MNSKNDKSSKRNDPNFLFRHGYRVTPMPGVPSCRMCHSPTHPATGSSDGFCGACVRSLILTMREVAHPSRRVRGYNFYRYAAPLNDEYHTPAVSR